MKVKIFCKQTYHFEKEVEMDQQDYDCLNDALMDDDTIYERNGIKAYGVLEAYLCPTDVIDTDREYTDVEVFPHPPVKITKAVK